MVPPAMMTALHSFRIWAKWTAGFSSKNLTLLSDKVSAYENKHSIFNQRSFRRVYFDLCFDNYTLVVHHHSTICVAAGESHEETLHLHHGGGSRRLLCL